MPRTRAEPAGIVFLAKNGIGFGHLTRCLLLTKALRQLAPEVGVTMISQAGSLLTQQGAEVPVINFPLLHHLPSNAMEHAHMALLDGVLAELAPCLVVEDTYPDPHYLRLPSIRECRRVLVQRRIDCVSFERFRREGEFAPYDQVLLAQSPTEFNDEGHTPASRLLVESSGRFKLLGPVYRAPTPEELHAAAARYAPDGSAAVVVNAGAGGDHFNDAYCERLFTAMSQVASRFLSERLPAEFIFVLGPYFAGRQPPALPNVTFVRYEPLLHALLHQARVVVARPGHNAVHETLAGSASLILIPGISWMESQLPHSQRLARLPGVLVGDIDDPEGLHDLVRHALTAPPPPEARVAAPATRAVAHALLEELAAARAPLPVESGAVFLLVRGADTPARTATVRHHIPGACVLSQDQVIAWSALHRGIASGVSGVYSDVPPSPNVCPEELHRQGVRVLFFSDHGDDAEATREWVHHHGGIIRAGLLPIELYSLRGRSQRSGDLSARLARLLRHMPIAAIDLDVSSLADPELGSYAHALAVDLDRPGLRLVGVEELIREHLSRHLVGEA